MNTLTDERKRELRLEAKKMVQDLRQECSNESIHKHIEKIRSYAIDELREATLDLQMQQQVYAEENYMADIAEQYVAQCKAKEAE